MLHIREEQLAAMRQSRRDAFVQRAAVHLRATRRGAAAMEEEALTEHVRRAIDHAATYGVVAEEDIVRFAALTLRLGPSFDTDGNHAWAVSLLRSQLPAAQKLSAIGDLLRPRKR